MLVVVVVGLAMYACIYMHMYELVHILILVLRGAIPRFRAYAPGYYKLASKPTSAL